MKTSTWIVLTPAGMLTASFALEHEAPSSEDGRLLTHMANCHLHYPRIPWCVTVGPQGSSLASWEDGDPPPGDNGGNVVLQEGIHWGLPQSLPSVLKIYSQEPHPAYQRTHGPFRLQRELHGLWPAQHLMTWYFSSALCDIIKDTLCCFCLWFRVMSA